MALKVIELKVGNWVDYGGVPYQVTSISNLGKVGISRKIDSGIISLEAEIESLRGIKFTKEILYQLDGFKEKDYQGLPGSLVARMAKIIIPCKPKTPEPEEAESSTDDGVEPENIPVVTHDDEDPSVMDEPITEDELQEGVLGDVTKTVRGNIVDAARSYGGSNQNDNTMTVIKNALSTLGKRNKKIFAVGGIIAGVIVLPIAIVKIIIPFIRGCVYYFYYTKMKVSDYLEIQAELIEANANELENSTDSDLTEEKKAKVAERQRKWAERLRKWSNTFAIDHKQATNAAKKEAEKDAKEKKTVRKDDDGDDSIF